MKPVALVTGATRGLGLAIARELGRDHHVLVGGRSASAVHEVVASLPSASPFVADLTSESSTAAAVALVREEFSRLDVLVNNAGVALRARVEETSREQWRWLLETNVVAVADLTRLCLPMLRETGGLVVMVNSGAGVRTYPSDTAYTATKWALRALTECIREDERGLVRVTSLHPGRIATEMQQALQAQVGRPYDPSQHMDPADVARCVRLAVSLPPSTSVDELHVRTTEPKA